MFLLILCAILGKNEIFASMNFTNIRPVQWISLVYLLISVNFDIRILKTLNCHDLNQIWVEVCLLYDRTFFSGGSNVNDEELYIFRALSKIALKKPQTNLHLSPVRERPLVKLCTPCGLDFKWSVSLLHGNIMNHSYS